MFCFCFFHTFVPIFHFKHVVFVDGDGGRKNISCPMAQGTLATSLRGDGKNR